MPVIRFEFTMTRLEVTIVIAAVVGLGVLGFGMAMA